MHIFENIDDSQPFREGPLVDHLLTSLRIDHKLYEIHGREDLLLKSRAIVEEDMKWQGTRRHVFHWSGHGNEEGVQLSNGKMCSWSLFGLWLCAMGKSVRERLLLCMSSCMGAYASTVGEKWPMKMYAHLIGPVRNIGWDEAAIAYANFYYAALVQGINVGDAIKWMNTSILSEYNVPSFIYVDGTAQAIKNQTKDLRIKKLAGYLSGAMIPYRNLLNE